MLHALLSISLASITHTRLQLEKQYLHIVCVWTFDTKSAWSVWVNIAELKTLESVFISGVMGCCVSSLIETDRQSVRHCGVLQAASLTFSPITAAVTGAVLHMKHACATHLESMFPMQFNFPCFIEKPSFDLQLQSRPWTQKNTNISPHIVDLSEHRLSILANKRDWPAHFVFCEFPT
jgi:hypothetical protein